MCLEKQTKNKNNNREQLEHLIILIVSIFILLHLLPMKKDIPLTMALYGLAISIPSSLTLILCLFEKHMLASYTFLNTTNSISFLLVLTSLFFHFSWGTGVVFILALISSFAFYIKHCQEQNSPRFFAKKQTKK